MYSNLLPPNAASPLDDAVSSLMSSSKQAPVTASGQALGLPRRKLIQAVQYIHQHLAEAVSVEAIATHLGMSQFHFCRLFKGSMGVSPYQYLLRQRVERAKQLLIQGTFSISEIALEVGFSSQSHLTRHFKRVVGVSPKKFMQQLP